MSVTFTFEAKYQPGQAIKIVALDLAGTVTMVRIDEGGTTDFYVVWWADGKRCAEWLRASEVTTA